MSEITGARSVPRVFIGGKFYGGGDEMMNMHRNKTELQSVQTF